MESIGITVSTSSTEVYTENPNRYGLSSISNNVGTLRLQTEITSGINFNTKYPPATVLQVNGSLSTVVAIAYNGDQTVSASTAGGQIDTDRAFTAATTTEGNVGKSLDLTAVGLI